MPSESSPPTSFSARRRWIIFFSVLISIAAVVALVGMINYLGGRHFLRFTWSNRTEFQLSPQTVNLLNSITNQVKVTIYYKKSEPLFNSISALLNEYHLANQNISIETVDYIRDPAGAQQIQARYNKNGFEAVKDKNQVIFDSKGIKFVQGDLLADYSLESVQNDEQREFRNKLKAFKGEGMFNSILLSVTNPKLQQAYFLITHGEHNPAGKDTPGYSSFTTLLFQNNVMPNLLNLVGTNPIPADCSLLIIAGPRQPLFPSELEKLRQYLTQGRRMFVLFNSDTVMNNKDTGLESLLAEWGVDVGRNYVIDANNTTSESGYDLIVTKFNEGHPLVNPLLAFRLRMLRPRSIGKLENAKQGADAPKVDELAWTSDQARINDSLVSPGKRIPLMVAVEKKAIKGVYAEGGGTRIVVAGDSSFLDNQIIEVDRNQEFAANAINWLLERAQLLEGVGPHPIKEYRFLMTKSQMNSVQWLLLAAMPGAILLLGGLVWLRRRQ
jgi:ABC-2 type transport system permease protein